MLMKTSDLEKEYGKQNTWLAINKSLQIFGTVITPVQIIAALDAFETHRISKLKGRGNFNHRNWLYKEEDPTFEDGGIKAVILAHEMIREL